MLLPVVAWSPPASASSQGNGRSTQPAMNADGSMIAFVSEADNLVPGDTNGAADVFVRDRRARTIARISVTSDGRQTDARSSDPSVSADGRYVAFTSASSVLPGRPAHTDVYVHDQVTKQTRLVSRSSSGVAGNGPSEDAEISADGSVIAFTSAASNLVGRDTNAARDVFVHILSSRRTSRVSLSSESRELPQESSEPSVSADGSRVAFFSRNVAVPRPAATHSAPAVFVRDRLARRTLSGVWTETYNEDEHGWDYGYDVEGRPRLHPDGRTVAAIVWDWVAGSVDDDHVFRTEVVGQAAGSAAASEAGDVGTFAYTGGTDLRYGLDGLSRALQKDECNHPLDPCPPALSLHDIAEERYYQLPGNFELGGVSLQGRSVAVASDGSWVSGDTNGVSDVYVWTPSTGRMMRISVP